MVEMAGKGIRRGIRGVPMQLLVLLILGLLEIIIFESAMGLGNREPNFELVELV